MTKLDNLVHIAHNVKIGMGCLLASGVGIAGSVTIEDYCILAGQSGVVPHVTVGSKSIIAVKSGVTKSLKGGEIYSGMPARKIREQNKKDAILSSVSLLKNRIEKLEKITLKNDTST
jgi:UDP-3-O-[3-hydroxymyristoyl] glucosamine N-acyltransferase